MSRRRRRSWTRGKRARTECSGATATCFNVRYACSLCCRHVLSDADGCDCLTDCSYGAWLYKEDCSPSNRVCSYVPALVFLQSLSAFRGSLVVFLLLFVLGGANQRGPAT